METLLQDYLPILVFAAMASALALILILAGVTGGAGGAEGAGANQNLTGLEVEAKQRVWWSLLLVALGLLLAESILARRTKVVKMIG